ATVTVSNPPAPPGPLRAEVRTSSGAPIGGASVSAGGCTQAASADGTYDLSLTAGTYDATASAQFYASETVTGVHVNAASTTWQNFTLNFNAGWIAGTVKNAADGTPISVAGIVASSSSGGQFTNSTNSAGRYNLTVDVGTYTVNASATGFNKASKPGV